MRAATAPKKTTLKTSKPKARHILPQLPPTLFCRCPTFSEEFTNKLCYLCWFISRVQKTFMQTTQTLKEMQQFNICKEL